MHRRALTAVLASATVALGGALTATSAPAQAEGPSPLVLRAPDQVTATSYRGWVYSDFGFRLIARGEHFVVHATRPDDYEGPIEAVWKRESGDVPLGEMSTWQGLDRFAHVQVFQDGERIRHRFANVCFNGSSRQIGPGAPEGPTNPFPWGCPWNPYTLGSVMGVAQDHSASLLSEWGTRMRLEPGRYRVVAGITDQWREKLELGDAGAPLTTRLTVERPEREPRRGEDVSFATPLRSGTDQLETTTSRPTAAAAGEMVSSYAPDLRSLPAFDIGLNGADTALRFGATVWNGGAGPLVIEGFRRSRQVDHMTAYQYYFNEHGERTGYDRVGELHFHEGNHQHWHFEDFARYRLYSADAEGNIDTTQWVKSTKQSFCLVATDAVDLTVPNADMRPEYTDLSSQCGGPGALRLREVLANGHGDTYFQYRTGQAFRLNGVEDGIYYVAVEANPDDADGPNLQELDYANNSSYRKIRLFTTESGERRVRSFQVGQVNERELFPFFRMR